LLRLTTDYKASSGLSATAELLVFIHSVTSCSTNSLLCIVQFYFNAVYNIYHLCDYRDLSYSVLGWFGSLVFMIRGLS